MAVAVGWSEDALRMEERWSTDDLDRVRADAADLAKLKPDVIFFTGGRVTRIVQEQTRSIPTVFVGVSNPLGQGWVAEPRQAWRQPHGYRAAAVFNHGEAGRDPEADRPGGDSRRARVQSRQSVDRIPPQRVRGRLRVILDPAKRHWHQRSCRDRARLSSGTLKAGPSGVMLSLKLSRAAPAFTPTWKPDQLYAE
jgi:hypothetical protein